VDSLAALGAVIFSLPPSRVVSFWRERSGALLMDAFFSATLSRGTFGLVVPWWKYALDFSDVATPVHGHALYLKQETRPR
jgi:hypothetical protein